MKIFEWLNVWRENKELRDVHKVVLARTDLTLLELETEAKTLRSCIAFARKKKMKHTESGWLIELSDTVERIKKLKARYSVLKGQSNEN